MPICESNRIPDSDPALIDYFPRLGKQAMRKLFIIVTDENGVLLDRKEAEVRDGISALYVQEIIPGTDIIEHGVAELEIGTQRTTWRGE